MWPSSSGEHIHGMNFFQSDQALQAEISYRQERLKRDFQRPWWFKRQQAKPAKPTPCLPAVHARHAM